MYGKKISPNKKISPQGTTFIGEGKEGQLSHLLLGMKKGGKLSSPKIDESCFSTMDDLFATPKKKRKKRRNVLSKNGNQDSTNARLTKDDVDDDQDGSDDTSTSSENNFAQVQWNFFLINEFWLYQIQYHKLAPLQTKDYKDLSQALDDDEDVMPPLSQYDSGSESDEDSFSNSEQKKVKAGTSLSQQFTASKIRQSVQTATSSQFDEGSLA